jgi:hypothetical protein
MARQRPAGLLVMADPYLNNRRQQIIEFTARLSIPAIYEWREDEVHYLPNHRVQGMWAALIPSAMAIGPNFSWVGNERRAASVFSLR